MHRLVGDIRRARPDTIVVASPHNLRLWRHLAVITAENARGELDNLKLHCGCDVPLARQIIRTAERRNLPVVGANFGTSEGPASCIQLDWGTFVPLWFFLRATTPKAPKVVVVAPSREIPLSQNFLFGRAIADTCSRSKARVAFVASADQSHVHRASGPYGRDSAAAEKYDTKVIRAIENNDLAGLMEVPMSLVERAKPDSLWQLAVLAGVLSRVSMRPEVYSYDVPTYYGMLCAGFSMRREC